MAATVSAWSKPGAWAIDSEEHEAELLQQNPTQDTVKPLADFPSLAVAAATKPKKKKAQTYSLAEFTAKPDTAFADQDPVVLPTGPRQRTAEELDRTRLGGGFRSYGDRPNRNSSGEDSSSRWGSSRVSDEPRRNGSFGTRDSNRELPPSRADETDNWAAAKKPSGGFERRERDRGGFFDSQSRADESESWVSNKSFVPSERRSNGGGFERERKVIGFGSSGGADSNDWNKKKGESNVGSESVGAGGGRPRLVLQPRSLSVSNEGRDGNVGKPKGVNPFGEARPREQVLAEKGQDWKKIDEQLESMKIKETGGGDAFVKRGFGSSNGGGRAALPESRTERSWRKPISDDESPKSAEKVEDKAVEEN
ncbi:eukaryotic translation initiation factor 4B3 [Vigna radiata var. radiata]|uniref:Eukaryotic translation initiation factor 4B3 n=1 Tax=Vigna radiata var. radiata TaxID=3916 RepID=A0A1S3VKX3_VIGRR|nr:eukaryotic translation initiation factor 4B3 [Vigna radiata var. radiata]